MEQVEMITNVVNHISGKDKRESYMKLISLVATQIKLSGVIQERVTDSERQFFTDNFNLSLLKENISDWFTQALEYDNVVSTLSPESIQVVSSELDLNYKGDFVTPLFVPYQAGRLMVMAYTKMRNNALYMCIENDLLLYRIALVNSKIYNIPSLVLNVDHTIYDVGLMSINWDRANKWTITGGYLSEQRVLR